MRLSHKSLSERPKKAHIKRASEIYKVTLPNSNYYLIIAGTFFNDD